MRFSQKLLGKATKVAKKGDNIHRLLRIHIMFLSFVVAYLFYLITAKKKDACGS